MKNLLLRPFFRLKRSLPTRLLLVFLITSLVISFVIASFIGHGFANQWRRVIRPHIFQYADYMNAEIGTPPNLTVAAELANELPINIYILGPDVNYSSTGQPLDHQDLEFRERSGLRTRRFDHDDDDDDPEKAKRRDIQRNNRRGMSFGEHSERTVLKARRGQFEIYYEMPHRHQPRDQFVGKLVAGILALLALSYFMISRMLRPVQDIKQGVQKMGAGELDYRVPVRADNDLGELAGSINQMAGDIENMLDAKQQLLLGVSHELRSPLTRATLAAQMLEPSGKRDQIQEDLHEMESLITDILESERMNSKHAALALDTVELTALINTVLQELGADNFSLTIDEDIPPLQLDASRTRLMLRNLISNAQRYSQSATQSPELTVIARDKQVNIAIRDFGPGIDPEHLPYVTEPFYRTDKARARATGGFGLGLYLARLIAEAHGGSLSVSCPTNGGTLVEVDLPDDQ